MLNILSRMEYLKKGLSHGRWPKREVFIDLIVFFIIR